MKVLKIVGVVIAVLVLAAIGVYAWASHTAGRKLSRTYATHTVSFPIPFPVSGSRIERRAAESLDGSRAEAVERGRHLIESRYGCGGCHGSDFGGGVMVDNFAIGNLLGPNLTTGEGSVTTGYTASDWDRIVRHGVKRNGTPALMPSQDFRQMSDQELSDIVVFIQSRPGVDKRVPPPALGPSARCSLLPGSSHCLRTSSARTTSRTRSHLRSPGSPPSSAVTWPVPAWAAIAATSGAALSSAAIPPGLQRPI
jgi:mono/diheme cytochrome c family protein